jgi:nitrate reductase NapE component
VLKLAEVRSVENSENWLAHACAEPDSIEGTMETTRQLPRAPRVPIAWKFFLLLALVVPSLLAVSWVGGTGMVEMKARLRC